MYVKKKKGHDDLIASGAEERMAGLQVNMVDFVLQANMEENGKKGGERWGRQAGPPAAHAVDSGVLATSCRGGERVHKERTSLAAMEDRIPLPLGPSAPLFRPSLAGVKARENVCAA